MSAAQAAPASRAEFIKNTYLHLGGAILVFGILESLLLKIPGIEMTVMKYMGGGMGWLVVLGLFMGVSWLANNWAHSDTSREMQYAGLGLYTLAQAVIFLPMVIMAQHMTGTNEIIYKSFGVTTGIFAALTLIALTTKKDFSFLGGFLKIAGITALGLIVVSIIFGFQLGIIFSGVMVLIVGAMVLYQTSNIVHHYGTHQHVAASLGLFASFATMLWYVMRIFMSRE